MTDESQIWPKLTETFREILEDDEIELTPETTAKDVEDWDSLSHIQLLVAVEQAFGVRFNTGEVAGLENVGEMVRLLVAKTS